MIPEFKSELEFNKFLISEYLRLGSIDKVFKTHNYNLPTSFASYHRLLNKYQVVKSAGPNSKLSESLHVLSLLNNYKLPLERIYHSYCPASIQVSTNTLHRILHNIRLGITKRVGIALLIKDGEGSKNVLVGQDYSLTDKSLGQKGDWSLPMGYTRQQDSFESGIKRVLQQEVFTNQTIKNKFPKNIIPTRPIPSFSINIADIKVYVFELVITQNHEFSSFKLQNLQFVDTDKIRTLKTRCGVGDILKLNQESSPKRNYNSSLNQDLLYLPVEAK